MTELNISNFHNQAVANLREVGVENVIPNSPREADLLVLGVRSALENITTGARVTLNPEHIGMLQQWHRPSLEDLHAMAGTPDVQGELQKQKLADMGTEAYLNAMDGLVNGTQSIPGRPTEASADVTQGAVYRRLMGEGGTGRS